jgi:hypothetical protein
MTGTDLLDLIAKYAGTAVTTFVAGGAGAYVGSYLKRKGENLATHEDIGKLVAQVGAVTQATKEIEARISDEVWNRQRQWELKRELLLETVKGLAELERAMSIYTTTFGPRQPGERRSSDGLQELWNNSLLILKRGRVMAAMIGGPSIVVAFEDIENFVLLILNKYSSSPGVAHQWLPEFRQLTAVVIDHLSHEVVLLPRSSGIFGSSSPDSPTSAIGTRERH